MCMPMLMEGMIQGRQSIGGAEGAVPQEVASLDGVPFAVNNTYSDVIRDAEALKDNFS